MSSYERLIQEKEEAGSKPKARSDTLMDFEANQGTAGDENDDFSDSLTAHMERKYLTEQHVDSFINIVGYFLVYHISGCLLLGITVKSKQSHL